MTSPEGKSVAPPKALPVRDAITPVSANASWFAALRGVVQCSDISFMYGRGAMAFEEYCSSLPQGTKVFLAWSNHTPDIHGYGTTAADAIADFNTKMVHP